MLKDLPQLLLREFLKNSKRSDRELAKVLGVSQPTITRMRHRLEKEGMIQDYTIVPNFKEMGFEILAITFVKMSPDVITPERMKEAEAYAAKFPNAIFSSMGSGLGMTGVVISFHKNYTDYHRQFNLMRADWGELLQDVRGFLVVIGEGEYKRFSLSHLKDQPI